MTRLRSNMSIGLLALTVGIGSAVFDSHCRAAGWQWSVPVKSEKPENGPSRAWLWIPPGCERVRGVVVAQHNMEEISILENPAFRTALAQMNFAEVWVAPFFDHLFRFNAGAGDTFNDFMDRLAGESGYLELRFVPVAPLGHSAAASWPYYFAAWNPQRTLCALSVSGQWPYFRDPKWAPDIWGDRTIDGVPCLETMGEYEAADAWSREGLRERQQHPKLPLSMLACPGEGHFASTDAKVKYLALYLRKCVEYRVPKDWDGNSAPVLIPVDPTRSGWLKEKWLRDKAPTTTAAPVGRYQGDPAEAFWFFDEELVQATEAYETRFRGLKPQLVGVMQDGEMVPQTDTHLQITPRFESESDGVTFKLAGAFYDAVPPGSPRLPNWTRLPTNAPLGHASRGEISINPISGPMERISAGTFALDLKRETLLVTNASRYELVLAATHPGDAAYKPAVQQVHLYVPARNIRGTGQRILFPEIPDQSVGTRSLKLNATSDAGVPVHYLVREGPAEVDGDTLTFTPIPPRAEYPVKVTVVAWQYGRSVAPELKTAAPVERSFQIKAATGRAESGFVHPGLLQNREDLDRIRQAVNARAQPIYSGYKVFSANPASRADYRMRGPVESVGRNPAVGQAAYDSDANAAYQCALMWAITGDRRYADKAKEIVNAWSGTLKSITGRDAVLMAGLGPFKMVNAAEILRHTDSGWTQVEADRAARHFREVIYPVIKDFAPFANGNWDAAALKTMLAIAVYTDDRAMFERALDYYVHGAGDGRLTHYIIDDTGQCQESGRDQQHTQLGLAHLADCCEIAWHQGLDLYGYADNRLLKGFEYTAKYNLGEAVPFSETVDQTGKYRHSVISTKGRGRFRAVYEQVYNYYAKRRGINAPYTARAAERIRPEGAGLPGADHTGFGTLLYSRASEPNAGRGQQPPAAPAGIIAEPTSDGIRLRWVACVAASSYDVKRADGDGPFAVVANNISEPKWLDVRTEAGHLYRYAITASNANGQSPDSLPVTICAGLPKGWNQEDVGGIARPGNTVFDGDQFSTESAGSIIGGTNDQFHFVFRPVSGDATVAARFVPQTSSQVSKFGLMLRDGAGSEAANVSLLIMPDATGDAEAPAWRVQLRIRRAPGTRTEIENAADLPSPAVTFGRLTGFCWLRLQRAGDAYVGSYSLDGTNWNAAGSVKWSAGSEQLGGFAVCSGLERTATTVTFDHVSVWNAAANSNAADVHVESPDGTVAVRFRLSDSGGLRYEISYKGKPVVLESGLGFRPAFTNSFTLAGRQVAEHASTWTNLFGERRVVPDNYRELTIDLAHSTGRKLQLVFRAYNEGAAFRYRFPTQAVTHFNFSGECSEFRFPQGTYGYEEHGTEGIYHRVPVEQFQPYCEKPLTLEFSSGFLASLNEAANFAYPRLLLSPSGSAGLVSALGGSTSNTERLDQNDDPRVSLAAGDASPWRLIILGDRPGDLLERNYLELNLNPPCAIADTGWIRPGKVMRDTTLTTTNSKAIIDLATVAGLQYVHLDARWYGTEDAIQGDATQSRKANLDVPEIIRYGQQKNVGLIVYVDRRQIKRQRDILFPLYERWGVKGVKIGFVDVGPQKESAWITETIQKAAEHHLMLNIHDGFRSSGLSRTYPNLMTVEGIRGNEHFPTAEHNCTLPFTRYVGGAGDYTICYYEPRLKTSHAHQLAMAVISFSPLQWILWYDQPSEYAGEPEMEFFRRVPTVWDETRVLGGEIGRFAAVARRKGQQWFVGVINGTDARRVTLDLGILRAGEKYVAHCYSDDETVSTKTRVQVETRVVERGSKMELSLKPSGGFAMWLAPAN